MKDFFGLDAKTVAFLVLSVLVLFLQLSFCFKAKRVVVKLIPTLLAAGSAVVFYLLALRVGGWSGVACVILAFFSALLFLACCLGWGIWAIWVLLRRRR